MEKETVEKIYAGLLAKVIGIRLGAPVEGWSAERIRNVYDGRSGYLVDYHDFAADDDSNGPVFFFRALEDSGKGRDLTAQDVGLALLNYAPYEHGFFWWGGYGVSTEHTAYLNLRKGIEAPRSGSIAQNGRTVAEQIGGQIFVDTWGLALPGHPDLAADLAGKAASVTHDGNGMFGGRFIAACISEAFVEMDMEKIIDTGLAYIPDDCAYAGAVHAIRDFYHQNPNDPDACWEYIQKNFGYDKYPGMCHIIPNICVMIMGMLYGHGDFDQTLEMINRCGWDTDCNVGNVATIMGVRNGLAEINYEKWRSAVNDLLIGSSVLGSLNILDIPSEALYIARMGAQLLQEELPVEYQDLSWNQCHFELPGSTQAMRVRKDTAFTEVEYSLVNTDESAASGCRSLKVSVNDFEPGENIYIYKRTYYQPKDFHDSRYDPSFSPLVYPGQTVHGSVMVPDYGLDVCIAMYVHELHADQILHGEFVRPDRNGWVNLSCSIPKMEGALIDEIGFLVTLAGEKPFGIPLTVFVDDLYWDGNPEYVLLAQKEHVEFWNGIHQEISQFTLLKGLFYLEDNAFHLSADDYGEAYTGSIDWKDYDVWFYVTPLIGDTHFVNVRVQGAMRSYAVGFSAKGKAAILKNENGYRVLTETDFSWEMGKEYCLDAAVTGNKISLSIDNKKILEYVDQDHPYRHGCIGLSVQNGSHISCRKIEISKNH